MCARHIGWAALAFSCVCGGQAGAQANVAGADSKAPEATARNLPAVFNTMRPIRNVTRVEITVGQGEGDLQGNDDKIIQAAVDYVTRLGGGVVHVLPGTYTMRNSLFLKPGITLRGSGEDTILKKAPSVTSPVIREADWYEYALQVADPRGFTPGCGICVYQSGGTHGDHDVNEVQFYTVTKVQANVLYLDRRAERDFWPWESANVQTIFSILYGRNADDVAVEGLVLDGSRAENAKLDDNYGGACYGIYCDRWNFRNVAARNFNGDGFSFQVCDDWHFENCRALNNADLGFHSGSGSQRPILKNCTAEGNNDGFYWCWGSCDGLVEKCTFSQNSRNGVNFGHRDTDNVVRDCVLERNGKAGVYFRREPEENCQGDRNRIEGCLIRDNGGAEGECGVDIQWKTHDIAILNCRFENGPDGKQKVAIRISPEAERITMQGNTFTGCPVEVDDERPKAGK
jgi:hypothetical protein